jgi:hypothetical protein
LGTVYVDTVSGAGVAVLYSRTTGKKLIIFDVVVGIIADRAGDRGSDGGLIACLAVYYGTGNAGVV